MSRVFRVVETDNFAGDYPAEVWITPCITKDAAEQIADILNRECSGPTAFRIYVVRPETYELQPGFEP